MSRPVYLTCCLLVSLHMALQAQPTRFTTDPHQQFWQAREHFQAGRWSLAYPMFRELQRAIRDQDRDAWQMMADEIDFYTTASALRQNESFAEADAQSLIRAERNEALVKKMHFHLGEFQYRRSDFNNAVSNYESSDLKHLSNSEIADMRFHQGHAYFRLGRYERAKPLFQSVRQLKDHPGKPDADYGYGYICYTEQNLSEALEAFRKVQDHPEYRKAVPFYIADILYRQGRKEEALTYAEANLLKTTGSFAHQMNQFLGHAYFEKRDFAKALPRLEAISQGPEKLSRAQLYELSFSYHATSRYAEAADGFSQLSNGSDSLSQSAMYLLGDAYLKLGRKPDARNAFAFCASNSKISSQQEIAAFHFAKLSYELGYQDAALTELRKFVDNYAASKYHREASDLLLSLLAGTNNFRDALDLIESQPSPSDAARRLFPKVAYGRAMELLNDQDFSGAEKLLDKVLFAPFNNTFAAPSRFWKGEMAYRNGQFDQSITILTGYLESSSNPLGDAQPLHARYTLGYAFMRKEQYRAAQPLFNAVSRSARQNATAIEQDAMLREADCRYMLKDLSGARSLYERIVSYSWPSSSYAYYQLAMIAGVADPSRKASMLSAFDQKYPTSEWVPQANIELASTYLANEQYREAVPVLQEILRTDGRNSTYRPKAMLRLGIAYFNLDKNRDAIAQYEALLAEYPNTPEADDALESAKAIYLEEGRVNDYADFLRKSGRNISIDQEDSLSWSSAETRMAENDAGRTVQAMASYLARFPQGQFALDAHFHRAEAYMKRNDWQNALADYQYLADQGQSRYTAKAAQQAGRLNYFQKKDYVASEKYFEQLKSLAENTEQRLDAMRGLLRAQYQLRTWSRAAPNASELLGENSMGTDDRVLAAMVLGNASFEVGNHNDAMRQYKTVLTLSNAGFAAEARYKIAESWLLLGDLKNAEKAGMETINRSGSYDYWITKAYILLADVFWKQKDYFNAKATLKSVVDNSRSNELREEARTKLASVMEEEKKGSKLGDQ